jgi:hypothetical protein
MANVYANFSTTLDEDYDQLLADADDDDYTNLPAAALECSGGIPSQQGVDTVGTGQMEQDDTEEAVDTSRDEILASDWEEDGISNVTTPAVCHNMNKHSNTTSTSTIAIPTTTKF